VHEDEINGYNFMDVRKTGLQTLLDLQAAAYLQSCLPEKISFVNRHSILLLLQDILFHTLNQ
jgi:hypothetical protein